MTKLKANLTKLRVNSKDEVVDGTIDGKCDQQDPGQLAEASTTEEHPPCLEGISYDDATPNSTEPEEENRIAERKQCLLYDILSLWDIEKKESRSLGEHDIIVIKQLVDELLDKTFGPVLTQTL